MAGAAERLRWTSIDDEAPLPGMGERITHPEFQGIEFVHVRAKSLLNHVPSAAQMPFDWTINTYRGCSHACTYCLAPDTPVLLADGRTRRIEDVRVGDRVYGTVRDGRYRRYAVTDVRDHWRTVKRAYRVTVADGTTLVTSGDHRLLTERGWKHVADAHRGQRPHLTTGNQLRGTGRFSDQPKHDDSYRTGYLTGMIRGDGSIGRHRYERPTGRTYDRWIFRLALVDEQALTRSAQYLEAAGVPTTPFTFTAATGARREVRAIRTQRRASIERIQHLITWPDDPPAGWWAGFLAGVFDAEGGCSGGVLRISNTDPEMLEAIARGLDRFGFDHLTEPPATNGGRNVRLRGGLRERLRFFHSTDPAITRKRTMEGLALESDADLRVTAIEDLGVEIPMYDITTGTGDFIADGVVHHNCFARPSHTWLDLDAGRDFESVIVVKINAVERLRAELRAPRWQGEHVALGTNTDPYQRAEGRYRLTRGVIETLTDAGNSYSVLTKGTLITRDLDVLADAAKRGVCTGAALSIPTLDDDVWRGTEPGTPHPARRMETVAALADAGVPTGVMVAPIIPGLSDGREQLERVVRAAIEAGASHITPISLHLRSGVREIFLPWLEREHPELADRYRRLYQRAYAPEFERKRISRLVHELVAANGGVRPHPATSHRRFRGGARRPNGAGATTADGARASGGDDARPDDTQLSLW